VVADRALGAGPIGGAFLGSNSMADVVDFPAGGYRFKGPRAGQRDGKGVENVLVGGAL
jgi:hypothetical protein